MPTPERPLADRFWEKVVKSDEADGCWVWSGSKSTSGYGMFGIRREVDAKILGGAPRGMPVGAHRVAKQLTEPRNEWPVGHSLTIDHLCRNKSCVRPSHLEWVPQAVNSARSLRNRGYDPIVTAEDARRELSKERPHSGRSTATHCGQGHEYAEVGFMQRRSGDGRRCKACAAYYHRMHLAKKKAAAPATRERRREHALV